MGLCGCHAGHTRLGLYGCQSRTVGGLTSPRCRTHTAPVDLAQTASSRWRVPSGHAGHTRLGGRFSMHIIKGFWPGETGGIREKKKNLSWSFLETLEATPVSNMILCLHTFGLLSLRVFFEGVFFPNLPLPPTHIQCWAGPADTLKTWHLWGTLFVVLSVCLSVCLSVHICTSLAVPIAPCVRSAPSNRAVLCSSRNPPPPPPPLGFTSTLTFRAGNVILIAARMQV